MQYQVHQPIKSRNKSTFNFHMALFQAYVHLTACDILIKGKNMTQNFSFLMTKKTALYVMLDLAGLLKTL